MKSCIEALIGDREDGTSCELHKSSLQKLANHFSILLLLAFANMLDYMDCFRIFEE